MNNIQFKSVISIVLGHHINFDFRLRDFSKFVGKFACFSILAILYICLQYDTL